KPSISDQEQPNQERRATRAVFNHSPTTDGVFGRIIARDEKHWQREDDAGDEPRRGAAGGGRGGGAREAALLEDEARRAAAEAPCREFWVRSQELLPELRRWPRPCPPPLATPAVSSSSSSSSSFQFYLPPGWSTARGW
uniref:Uncharacterized protein n=1 Tax=Triticum urartu TaxID=4572 RepID=A0A8R7VJ26_TRIUA